MGEFNLLTEPWISVITDERGKTEEVSLIDVFKNADKYIALAGNMKAQDFAVMRVLLAVLHTVFSRFDSDGNPYDSLELDEKFMQNAEVNEDDEEDYLDDLTNTWIKIWKEGKFPDIIETYLEKWKDRFYLYDDKYPFFQVPKKVFETGKYKNGCGNVRGKYINRKINESDNKTSLFSSKRGRDDDKNLLTDSEAARWLITYHQYTGNTDKKSFEIYEKVSFYDNKSKGWLYELGGLYLGGNNLFETLWLNCILIYPEKQYRLKIQRPCWEYKPDENIVKKFQKPAEKQSGLKNQRPCWEYSPDENIVENLEQPPIDNIAELYTIWSRAAYIVPTKGKFKNFHMKVVKFPRLNLQNNFLEPMTVWNYSKKNNVYKPKIHLDTQSLWRSFGLIAMGAYGENVKMPGIISWLNKIKPIIGIRTVKLNALSIEGDGLETSNMLVNEIYDSLTIEDFILTDNDKEGWTIRVNEVINLTKKIVETTFGDFVSNVAKIRNINSEKGYKKQKLEELYFKIDKPFREWIGGIKDSDEKDEKIREWKECLKKLVIESADEIMEVATDRDFIGIKKGGNIENIAIAYNSFINKI